MPNYVAGSNQFYNGNNMVKGYEEGGIVQNTRPWTVDELRARFRSPSGMEIGRAVAPGSVTMPPRVSRESVASSVTTPQMPSVVMTPEPNLVTDMLDTGAYETPVGGLNAVASANGQNPQPVNLDVPGMPRGARNLFDPATIDTMTADQKANIQKMQAARATLYEKMLAANAQPQGGINLPMLAAASAMMQPTKGGFFGALGNAGQAAIPMLEKQRAAEAARQQRGFDIEEKRAELDALADRGSTEADMWAMAQKQGIDSEMFKRAMDERKLSASQAARAAQLQLGREQLDAQREYQKAQIDVQRSAARAKVLEAQGKLPPGTESYVKELGTENAKALMSSRNTELVANDVYGAAERLKSLGITSGLFGANVKQQVLQAAKAAGYDGAKQDQALRDLQAVTSGRLRAVVDEVKKLAPATDTDVQLLKDAFFNERASIEQILAAADYMRRTSHAAGYRSGRFGSDVLGAIRKGEDLNPTLDMLYGKGMEAATDKYGKPFTRTVKWPGSE